MKFPVTFVSLGLALASVIGAAPTAAGPNEQAAIAKRAAPGKTLLRWSFVLLAASLTRASPLSAVNQLVGFASQNG